MSVPTVVQNSSSYINYPGKLSRYRKRRIGLSNVASNSVDLAISTVNQGEFRIAAGVVFNPARSHFAYQYGIPATGTAGQYNVVHECGQDMCSSISAGNGGGVNFADLQHADRYVKVMRSLRTTKEEFESLDCEACNYRSDTDASDNVLPFSRDGTTAGTQNSPSRDNDEVQYLKVGGNNAIMEVERELPLNAFKDTFFSLDKNLVFSEEFYIRFNTLPANKMCFKTTTPSNPHVGQIEIADPPTKLRNVYLYLAVEQNTELVEQVKQQMQGPGISLSIPYQYTVQNSSPAGGLSSNISISLNHQNGRVLKRILTAPFNGTTEKNAYTYDHSNVNGTKVTTVQASFDSVPLTDYVLNCFNPKEDINPLNKWTYGSATSAGTIARDDFRENKSLLVGSAMPTYGEYQTNWFYANTFGMVPMIRNDNLSVDESDIMDGQPLDGLVRNYNVQFTNEYAGTAANNYGGASGVIRYYTFIYTMLDIMIDSNGMRRV